MKHLSGGFEEFLLLHPAPGETFDDFLISLRELSKTCKFCSESCTEKKIRDQIIEGDKDGNMVEDLLQKLYTQ